MPGPADHLILDRIYCQLLSNRNIRECLAEPLIRDIARASECIEFTDDRGDWEIVVRRIEGGRD